MSLEEVPPPDPGPDPWCSGCDEEIDGERYFIDGEIWQWNYPPVFCAPECARTWGNAVHAESRLYRMAEVAGPTDESDGGDR